MGATTAEKKQNPWKDGRLGWATPRSNKEVMFVRTYFVVRLTFILSWLLEANALDRVEKRLGLGCIGPRDYDPVATPASVC